MAANLTKQAYDYIIGRLYSGQLAPGARLTNRGLAMEIGTSFTPVREALNRLVSEGFLSHQPGIGVFVPDVSHQTIKEIYEEREVLETFAARKICENYEKIDLSQIESNHKKMIEIYNQVEQTEDPDKIKELSNKWRQLDSMFHLSLLQAASNSRIFRSAIELQTLCQTVIHQFNSKQTPYWHTAIEEHGALLELFRCGNAEKAQKLLIHHIRRGCTLALNMYDHKYMKSQSDLLTGPHYFMPMDSHATNEHSASNIANKQLQTSKSEEERT